MQSKKKWGGRGGLIRRVLGPLIATISAFNAFAGVPEPIRRFETALRVNECPDLRRVGDWFVVGVRNEAGGCDLARIDRDTQQATVFFESAARDLSFYSPFATTVGSYYLFNAYSSPDQAVELWTTNGTTAGTKLLERNVLTRSPPMIALSQGLGPDLLALQASAPDDQAQLLITDGESIVRRVSLGANAGAFAVEDRWIYFTEGAINDPVTIKRVNVDTGEVEFFATRPAFPDLAHVFRYVSGGVVFEFAARRAVGSGGEAYDAFAIHRGANDATTLLSAFTTAGGQVVAGGLLFQACAQSACGIWASDGTESGTRLILPVDRTPPQGSLTNFGTLISDSKSALFTINSGTGAGLYRLELGRAVQLLGGSSMLSQWWFGANPWVDEYPVCRFDGNGARELWLARFSTAQPVKLNDHCDLKNWVFDGLEVYELRYQQGYPVIMPAARPPGLFQQHGYVRRNLISDETVPVTGQPSLQASISDSQVASNGLGVFIACTLVDCSAWATDGTAAGTLRIFREPGQFSGGAIEKGPDGVLYWRHVYPDRTAVLVRSDGTAQGTRRIATLGVSSSPTKQYRQLTGTQVLQNVPTFVSLRGTTYFANCEEGPNNPCGLWSTNGTASGTRLEVSIPSTLLQRPALTEFGGRVAFEWCVAAPFGCALYVSGGTAFDTYKQEIARYQGWTAWKGNLWVVAACDHSTSPAACQLVSTDGRPGSLRDMTSALRLDGRIFQSIVPAGDRLLVVQPVVSLNTSTIMLSVSEANPPEQLRSVDKVVTMNGWKLSPDTTLVSFGNELLITNGTPGGGTRSLDSQESRCEYVDNSSVRVDGGLIFRPRCVAGARSLWVSDLSGSKSTPVFDAEFRKQPGVDTIATSGVVNGRALFRWGGTNDAELWSVPVSLTVDPKLDTDSDGIPDTVELVEGTNPDVKDNDIFAATGKGVRLFVMQQYRDVFKREASEAEIAAGIAAVNAGGRAAFIASLIQSQTYDDFAGPITRLYRAYFLRNPDIGGYNFWTDEYNSLRWSFSAITGFFATSPEFRTRYGNLSNEQFVRLVYNNVLERDPDPSGLAFWLKELNDHDANPATGRSAAQLMADFSESPENKLKMKATVQRVAVYAAMLKQAAPEISITLNAPTLIETINSILGSAEYRARFLP